LYLDTPNIGYFSI